MWTYFIKKKEKEKEINKWNLSAPFENPISIDWAQTRSTLLYQTILNFNQRQ